MTTSSPIYDIRVILPHPSAQRVLLCRADDGGGWELPRWITSERHFWQSAGYINDGVRELLGIAVATLRCLGTAAARDELLRAFALARRVGPLHLALLYHHILLPNMEARWEMENMVGFYLKMLLRGRRRG